MRFVFFSSLFSCVEKKCKNSEKLLFPLALHVIATRRLLYEFLSLLPHQTFLYPWSDYTKKNFHSPGLTNVPIISSAKHGKSPRSDFKSWWQTRRKVDKWRKKSPSGRNFFKATSSFPYSTIFLYPWKEKSLQRREQASERGTKHSIDIFSPFLTQPAFFAFLIQLGGREEKNEREGRNKVITKIPIWEVFFSGSCFFYAGRRKKSGFCFRWGRTRRATLRASLNIPLPQRLAKLLAEE